MCDQSKRTQECDQWTSMSQVMSLTKWPVVNVKKDKARQLVNLSILCVTSETSKYAASDESDQVSD